MSHHAIHTLPQSVAKLPVKHEPWQLHSQHSGSHRACPQTLAHHLTEVAKGAHWKWPKRPVFFISDPHADSEAFIASLLATGGIKPPVRHDRIKLTKAGRKAHFVIGGDCLDKGPSNLRLLESIKALYKSGAKVTLIAGNHDMRLLMGLRALQGKRSVLTEHLFVRMGNKVVPLIHEVFTRYVRGKDLKIKAPRLAKCRDILYPGNSWFYEFPRKVEGRMPPDAVSRELERMGKKIKTFESECLKYGMTLRDVYITAQVMKKLFLSSKGAFGWFFKKMTLAEQSGSFLFLHAGLDDGVAQIVQNKGIKHLNKLYKQQLKKNLFEFYYGTVANVMRTKYRSVDLPLSAHGVDAVHQKGIYAVVHGHLNRTEGQRILLKQGLLHIEGDITLDRNSRKKEGLGGIGIGYIRICAQRHIVGVSSDYPRQKVFSPLKTGTAYVAT